METVELARNKAFTTAFTENPVRAVGKVANIKKRGGGGMVRTKRSHKETPEMASDKRKVPDISRTRAADEENKVQKKITILKRPQTEEALAKHMVMFNTKPIAQVGMKKVGEVRKISGQGRDGLPKKVGEVGKISVQGRDGLPNGTIKLSFLASSRPKKLERWAGPTFMNSPPPSELPFPTFHKNPLKSPLSQQQQVLVA